MPDSASRELQYTSREKEILALAEEILSTHFRRIGTVSHSLAAARFLRARLAHLKHEEFHAVWLDNHLNVIAVDRLFSGTVDGAVVHVREVVRAALASNAAAVIFAHNHPSGSSTPGAADIAITDRLRTVLKEIDVRVVDHFVVGDGEPTSMSARGML